MELSKYNTITVKKVENGYILQKQVWEDGDPGNKLFEEEVEVIGEDESDPNNRKLAFINLIYRIADYFELGYDKWSENNLSVTFDKRGHKCMGGNEDERLGTIDTVAD